MNKEINDRIIKASAHAASLIESNAKGSKIAEALYEFGLAVYITTLEDVKKTLEDACKTEIL